MSSFVALLILAAIGYYVFRIFVPKQQPAKLCTTCLSSISPKNATRGSILIEIILWLCFLIPGIIYSIWRLGSKHAVCPECGGKELIPLTSPRALKLLESGNASKT